MLPVNDFNQKLGFDASNSSKVLADAKAFIESKKPGQVDSPQVRAVKGMMREGEAKATCRYVGIPDENAHFQKLPFYETGTVKKSPMGPADIKLTVDLIKEIKPHQIYAAGRCSGL